MSDAIGLILNIESELIALAAARDSAADEEHFERLDALHRALDGERQRLIAGLSVKDHLRLEEARAGRAHD